MFKEPMICKLKRKAKQPLLKVMKEGRRFKILAKEIKTKLSVGGTFKDDSIIIQEITATK
jgi:translation initiation factor 1